MQSFSIEGIDITRAILGCDSFVSWMYQGSDSPFRGSGGNVDSLKAFEVMKASVDCGVGCIDLSPPLVHAFNMLQAVTDRRIEPLGAIQEWACRSFVIDGVPLAEYSDRIKMNMRSRLPPRYLEDMERSNAAESKFSRALFEVKTSAQPLTTSEIDGIKMKRGAFQERLELYRKLNVRLVQFGGGVADWLVALGRVDLLRELSHTIHRNGFAPVLICHWASLVLPAAERELDVAGYIVPLNKLWGLLTLSEALGSIRNVEKSVMAMKALAKGALVDDIRGAFSFLVKKAKVAGVMVGVSSPTEARQTFSTLADMLG